MSARLIARYADDPRVVTFVLVALAAAFMWLGIWQTMSGAAMVETGMGDAAMSGGAGVTMTGADWSGATMGATAIMWMLMMAAMMFPSMAPIVAIYAGLAAKEDRGARLALRIVLFTTGYFILWALFSVAAALGQLGLRGSEWFAMGGTLALPSAAGILLIVAGVYQFTAVKEFCLRHCRHPLAYLMNHWREGIQGAFPVGLHHGIHCLGCCIALMGLMFVFGAMEVLSMAAIAAYFVAEKFLPRAEIWSRLAGGLLIVAGMVTLAREVI